MLLSDLIKTTQGMPATRKFGWQSQTGIVPLQLTGSLFVQSETATTLTEISAIETDVDLKIQLAGHNHPFFGYKVVDDWLILG